MPNFNNTKLKIPTIQTKDMGEESDISRKTWARNIEPVAKIGYMDGASDGQNAAFQQSFDIGYEQGLNFGLELGCKEAMLSMQDRREKSSESPLQGINCQVCLNGASAQQNIGNLYNIQKEKNSEYLLKTQT